MNAFYVIDFLNKYKRALLLCLVVGLSVPLFAQGRVVDKANEYYKLNQFADAAGLFEQALGEMDAKRRAGRNAFNLKVKLAYCYRMNNKMGRAELLYAEVVQSENAKPETYYYYGEALMSNGKYDEARKYFLEYQKLQPEDKKADLMLTALDKVPFIQPYFQFIDVREFPYNSSADDNAPVAWKGGILFSSDRDQGIKLLKEKSGWTGRDYLDLYFSEKKEDGTFAVPKKFSSKLSEVNKNTGNASLTKDGTEIFFTQNDNVLNKQNTYNLQIYSARASGDDRWRKAEKLPFCSPNFNFMHPAVSPDGRQLFFVSNKPGGEGGTDIWVSLRVGETWSNPENLGPVVNTSANEGFPFIDGEGRLYFCSKGHPGFGGFDIFVTEKDENGNWADPLNLGKPINSSLDDISIYIAPDRQSGMFTSSRNGGDDDIFLFQVLDHSSVPEQIAVLAPAEPIQPELSGAVESPEELDAIKAEEPGPVVQREEVATQATRVEEKAVKPQEEPDAVSQQPHGVATWQEPVHRQEPLPPPPYLSEPVFPAPASEGEKTESMPQTAGASVSHPPEEVPAASQKKDPEMELSSVASALVALPSFEDLISKLERGYLQEGDQFRLDNAVYDPNVWQLTPRTAAVLDKIADILLQFPAIVVEIGAYTETLGDEGDNLRLSQNRAQTAVDYLISEGVPKKRLSFKGYGETRPLNRCHNGVNCSQEEHSFNQRLELKILRINGRK